MSAGTWLDPHRGAKPDPWRTVIHGLPHSLATPAEYQQRIDRIDVERARREGIYRTATRGE